ncbi:FAD-binding protein [Fundidesulfovibrio terrae]|uniref:FAD-binding protein n=1 Tax=Fundidesulfovibrio terrae TaxID=2922866 RepID=UPI001FB00BA5|nr:FAD-binding protein [Fundidesulfovibrio terrae]
MTAAVTSSIEADVLILGAGLAGLRAALSCLEASPSLRLAVASPSSGPSGSSFANVNDALGMHACLTDQDREDYVREVLALNRGAWLSPELLAVQAEESEARLRDLMALGVPFTRDASGKPLAHSSCFSPGSRRAFVFTGLSKAYECFTTRLRALGCRFLHGFQAASVLSDPARGALLMPCGAVESGHASARAECGGPPRPGQHGPILVRARAVVAAMGGPARLFAHSMAGPNPGFGQGVLARTGARMANLGFLQYMWGTLPGKTFWQPGVLGAGGYHLASPGSPENPPVPPVPVEELIPGIGELSARRAGHCPYGYSLEDSAIDLALAEGLDSAGVATLLAPDGTPLRVAPMAHASNGGAVIDEHGQTSVPGILACGECATGMHGANRVGGGMVLATQVFGHRAGVRAALIAENSCTEDSGTARCAELPADEDERREGLDWLARGLSRYAALGGRPGHAAFTAQVRRQLEQARDWRVSLSLETGLGILSNLPVA